MEETTGLYGEGSQSVLRNLRALWPGNTNYSNGWEWDTELNTGQLSGNLYVRPSDPEPRRFWHVLPRKNGKSSCLIKLKDLEKIKAASLGTEAPEQKLQNLFLEIPKNNSSINFVKEWMIWYSMIVHLQVMYIFKFTFFFVPCLPYFNAVLWKTGEAVIVITFASNG